MGRRNGFQNRLSSNVYGLYTFNQGDMASVVRFVGGPCTGSRRGVDQTLPEIFPNVDPDIRVEDDRIYTKGIFAIAMRNRQIILPPLIFSDLLSVPE